jgi:hypothetical protein
MLGKLDIHMKKSEIEHYFVPYTEINSEWIKDLHTGYETTKIQEGKK